MTLSTLRELSAAATKRPWFTPATGPWIASVERVVIGETPARDSDIAFIVSAVNSHDALLDLAERAVELQRALDNGPISSELNERTNAQRFALRNAIRALEQPRG
jgi:hypothetical protein